MSNLQSDKMLPPPGQRQIFRNIKYAKFSQLMPNLILLLKTDQLGIYTQHIFFSEIVLCNPLQDDDDADQRLPSWVICFNPPLFKIKDSNTNNSVLCYKPPAIFFNVRFVSKCIITKLQKFIKSNKVPDNSIVFFEIKNVF